MSVITPIVWSVIRDMQNIRAENKERIDKAREYYTSIVKQMKEYGLDSSKKEQELFAKIKQNAIENGKGVLFYGNTGSGKTERVKFVKFMLNLNFRNSQDVCDTWSDCEASQNSVLDYVDAYRYCSDVVIDDLGVEEQCTFYYGEKKDVMRDIVIPGRHKIFPRYRTFFTTNLTLDELRKRYGDRCWSRLNEMCLFYPIVHIDRRLQK